MALALPGASGIEAMRCMLAREPQVHVLIFSVHEEAIFVQRALDAGARGYVTKASAPDVLVEAMRAVARRVSYLSPDVSQALTMRASIQDGRQLSKREFEVLRLLVQGFTLPDIAEKLGLNQKTVANHQSVIRQKFGGDNGVQLAQIANRLGFISQTSRRRPISRSDRSATQSATARRPEPPAPARARSRNGQREQRARCDEKQQAISQTHSRVSR